jgi:hypothetical protein
LYIYSSSSIIFLTKWDTVFKEFDKVFPSFSASSALYILHAILHHDLDEMKVVSLACHPINQMSQSPTL